LLSNAKNTGPHLPIPTTVGQLRRTLGIFAYYRKFIKDFSAIAAPLHENIGKGAQSHHDKAKRVQLTEKAIKAFEFLKKTISGPLIV